MEMMKCVKKILMEVPLPNPHYAVDADDVDAADADGMEEDDPDGGDHSLLPSPPLPDPGWRRWPSPHSFIIPTSGQLIPRNNNDDDFDPRKTILPHPVSHRERTSGACAGLMSPT